MSVLSRQAGPPPKPNGRNAMKMLSPHIDNFNRVIRTLVTELSARYQTDAKIARAKSRVMTVITADPTFVIDTAGPYLYQYRKEIYALEENNGDQSEQFFLENTYDKELREAVDKEKADLVSYIIPLAKESARTLPQDKRNRYKKLIIDMLDSYIEYLCILNEN